MEFFLYDLEKKDFSITVSHFQNEVIISYHIDGTVFMWEKRNKYYSLTQFGTEITRFLLLFLKFGNEMKFDFQDCIHRILNMIRLILVAKENTITPAVLVMLQKELGTFKNKWIRFFKIHFKENEGQDKETKQLLIDKLIFSIFVHHEIGFIIHCQNGQRGSTSRQNCESKEREETQISEASERKQMGDNDKTLSSEYGVFL